MAIYPNSEPELTMQQLVDRNRALTEKGMQHCPMCRDTKPVSAFSPSSRGNYGTYCIECKRKVNRERYDARADHYAKAHRLNTYGLTHEAYMAMRAEQGNKCGCCERDLLALPERQVHVDRDHRTGVVRGILCGSCNTGLAAFLDDPALIGKVGLYLARTFDR